MYTHDDDMAEGVVSAIENADRADEMFLTGAGGSKAAMEQIKAGGLYRATFLYNPSMSAVGGPTGPADRAGQGHVGPGRTARCRATSRCRPSTVTKDNVDDVMDLGY